MNRFIAMATIQAELLVYLVIGVYAQKSGIISKAGRGCLIDYLLKIALPCMVFESFNQAISAQQVLSASFILVVSFIVCFASIVLGKALWRHVPPSQRSILRYGTLISNAGFAGMPLVGRAYGSLGLFYASIYVIPNRIFMWTSGISLFTQKDNQKNIKSVLLNPGIVAVALGIIRMMFRVPLPGFLDSAIKSIGSGTTALSMIIVGMILGNVPIKCIWDKRAFALAGVRLLLIPCAVLAVLKLLGMDTIALAAAVTLTGMPVGTTTPLLAEKYGADYEFASKCVFVSTALSLATVPLLSLFF